MPRARAIIFSDLIGKLDVLPVSCSQCGRDGCYGLSRLIDKRGRDAKAIDWLDELTAECPRKIAHSMNDPCGAVPATAEGVVVRSAYIPVMLQRVPTPTRQV